MRNFVKVTKDQFIDFMLTRQDFDMMHVTPKDPSEGSWSAIIYYPKGGNTADAFARVLNPVDMIQSTHWIAEQEAIPDPSPQDELPEFLASIPDDLAEQEVF